MSVTTITVTASQAGSMLKAVRFTRQMVETFERQNMEHVLPSMAQLGGNETMLLAALERIRDREQRRAAR